ncbi:DUF5670 family protein [Anaeromyxobacter oryzae]|uniref:Lmo0937 family membrane protein n=1 Tax=Anaeromyxobacter oryzae TaxID=2918170 RepID=A0ABN6MRY7_9BACT|nr:DUF5670 family protein [Anaeromyxobacter oryzae]BDG03711.1 hypothetical protein AMOR_27070 [Anaeromyxobacter oryzae]
MLMLLATILIVAWIVALAFKVTVGAIHLLLIAAIALYIIGFFRGRTGRATV